MAHNEQKNYFRSVKDKFPERFVHCFVLDIGSMSINGDNRWLFTDYSYTGLDIGHGKNVDIVCRGHEYDTEERFDIVISSECFEHDKFYKETILNAIRLTKPGGLFLFSCASTGRPEHGTTRTSPQDSPYTTDYYKNLNELDIREFLDVDNIFSEYEFQYGSATCDLYFWSLKK